MTEDTMTIEKLYEFPLDDIAGFATRLANYDWTDKELKDLHGRLVGDRKATADTLGKRLENPTESEQLSTGAAGGSSARPTDPNSVGGKLDLTARSRLLDGRVWLVWNNLKKRPISERQRNALERQQSFGAGASAVDRGRSR